jgi:hypothetical protein
MVSVGIFNDPNDFCLVLVTATAIAFYKWSASQRRIGRFGWLLLAGLFIYALRLTESRGGFLAFLAVPAVFVYLRAGWKVMIWLGPTLLLLVPFLGSRQSDLSLSSGGTGQERIQLWRDAVVLFREAPVFGIGKDEFGEQVSQVVHNSFLHCFAELGFFGGSCFLGIFYFSLDGLRRLHSSRALFANPELQRLLPCLLAIVAGYAVGLLSLSRPYVTVTYLIPGLAAAYFNLACLSMPARSARLTQLTILLSAVALSFVVAVYVFVRLVALTP